MSIQNPIGEGSKDPYDKYRDQIEATKRDEKDKSRPKESLASIAHLLLWMRGILSRFLKSTTTRTSTGLKEKVAELKDIFELLKKEDRSQDIAFTNNFSKIWNQMLDANLRQKKSGSCATLMQAFLKSIRTYPEGQEHTLGYYLTENSGQNWLPFPYIELLQKIHSEHSIHPNDSHLTRWTHQLNELITELAD